MFVHQHTLAYLVVVSMANPSNQGRGAREVRRADVTLATYLCILKYILSRMNGIVGVLWAL